MPTDWPKALSELRWGSREDDRLGEVLAENASVAVGDVDAENALPGEAVAVGVRLLDGDGDRIVMVEGVVDAEDDAVGVGVIADADRERVVEEVTVGERLRKWRERRREWARSPTPTANASERSTLWRRPTQMAVQRR
jgi:hypothetical protein